MIAYLDIDGVIMANDKRTANYAHEFVEYLINNYDVYWLTTHCHGDTRATVEHLKMFFNSETVKLFDKIKPTNWNILKTETIDFSKPFLWFEDDLFDEEKEVLKQHNCFESWIEINLTKDEDQLKRFIK